MDKEAAKKLLSETFDAPFDEGKFNLFALNLLNDVDTTKRFPFLSGNYIRDSFKNHITKYRRLGSCTNPQGETIDVLVVKLKNDWALEHSRTMLRNFTADYLENRGRKDSALVAYYTDNPKDWRFSYIRMDYKQELTDSGKIRVKKELTPARRYSFLVGVNEPIHTAQAQLLDILKDDRSNPTLFDLEAAFSVEAVTKQFYLDYRDLFIQLHKELDSIILSDSKVAKEFETKTIDTANFAKKLMGQIVFLYFLQKKGWLGIGKDENGNFKKWGSGPKNFLQRLFKKEFSQYKNFYCDVLEPLFYEALASEHDDDYYSALDCKIPFLNGGLFEPLNKYNWRETDIRIDNDILADVLTTFNQYNFTVREDEPLEKEVAIDPEMLGKVFENLLPENMRKGKGAYYTPRTIVHYMCQKSLMNYLGTECEAVPKADIETLIRKGDLILELETDIHEVGKQHKSVLMDVIKENAKVLDDALSHIKVCDPAIGSGAFSVGMLNEIVKARKVLELYLKKKETTYTLKRHFIQESIYGVDIDPGAIDIAKLRLWLSLVVDEEDYNNIQTLPNLDYKIMQGNSLIEEFHGISLDIEKKPDEQIDVFSGGSSLDALIKDLHSKQADFFNAEHPNDKKKKRNDVEKAIYNIFHNELEKKKNISPQETQDIQTDLKQMTHGHKLRNFFPWKLYFADVFLEKGGFDVVIANPPYGLINKKQNKHTSIKIELKIFEQLKKSYPKAVGGMINIYRLFILKSIDLLHGSGTFCEIFPLSFTGDSSVKTLRKHILTNHSILSIDTFPERDNVNKRVFEGVKMSVCIMNLSKDKKNTSFALRINHNKYVDYSNNATILKIDDIINFDEDRFSIPLINEKNKNLLNKIYSQSHKFKDFSWVYDGEVHITKHAKFITNNPNDKQLIKGAIVGRYEIRKEMSQGKIQYLNEAKYLASGCGNKMAHHNYRRIVMQRITGINENVRIKAMIVENGLYCANSIGYLLINQDKAKLYNPEILLSILNSSLQNYIFKLFSTNSNVNGYEIMNLPYPSNISRTDSELLNSSVKKRIAGDTSTEEIINSTIYNLFNLSDEEITIVEESVD